MKKALISFLLIVQSTLLCTSRITAQETPKAVSDPPQLSAQRLDYLREMQRISIPVTSNYLRRIESLKDQFVHAGDLQAALSVDAEIKKIKEELALATAAAQGARNATILPVTIISASMHGPDPAQAHDVTELLRKAFESGTPTLKCNGENLGGDPAPYKAKTLTVQYSVNGKVKLKNFADGGMINFRDDFK
jgi:hypothetical protein